MIHLHNTSDGLMWDVENLDIVGSPVSDPVYGLSTRRLLAESGNRLSVAVASTSFEDLVAGTVKTSEDTGLMWEKIRRGETDTSTHLESPQVIADRLTGSLRLFGEGNVAYAGPECGLGGFPTYGCAVKYLENIPRRQNRARAQFYHFQQSHSSID